MTNYADEIRKHPTVARPKVFLHTEAPAQAGKSARHTAECTHCDWTYTNVVKGDVEYQATVHRHHHRSGTTAVTKP